MLTTILLICASFYLGGVVCCIGTMLGNMTEDPDVQHMQPADYGYVLIACILWPGYILQQISTKD